MTAIGHLQRMLPASLRAGFIEPVFAEAWAFDLRQPVVAAALTCAGTRVPAIALGIDRPDVYERHCATPHRSVHARTSGMLFAGLLGPLPAGKLEVELEVDLADGSRMTAARDVVEVVEWDTPRADVLPGAEVVVAMATHNPDIELFDLQIESIRRQEHTSWVCIVTDDRSSRERLRAMRQVLGGDPRFILFEHDVRCGFYLNFERALALVPDDVAFVALSDQDDVWHPDKLSTQIAYLRQNPSTALVASDVRVTRPDGSLLADTFYASRRPTHDDPYSLFTVNSLIGASMVMRRELLGVALPFPRAFENRYHDHWLGRAGAVAGGVGFIDRPLHDYNQHADNVFGSRPTVRGRFRPFIDTLFRHWLGARLPAGWQTCFVENVLEVSITAQLLRARCPQAKPIRGLDRVIDMDHGQARELTNLLLDHARDHRHSRPGRESVELPLFAGRVWAMDHQPRVTT